MLKMISMREKEIKPDGSPDLQKRMESIRKVNILKKMKDLSLSLSIYIYLKKHKVCLLSFMEKSSTSSHSTKHGSKGDSLLS